MINHYKILEVEETASAEDIRIAYKRLAKMYHPDRNTSPHSTTIFQQLVESYRVLSDPDKRANFDLLWQYKNQKNNVSPRPKPPQYYQSSHYSQEDLIRPYLPYTYLLNKIFFAFALLIFADYISPRISTSEFLSKNYVITPGYDGSWGQPVAIKTREGSSIELQTRTKPYYLYAGRIVVKRSPIFRVPDKIVFADGKTFLPNTVVYGSLIFFPILLLLFSSLGIFLRKGVLFDFNITIVTGVLSVITLVITLISAF